MANGKPCDRQLAGKQLKQMGEGQLERLRCPLAPGEGIAEALLSDGKYTFPNHYGSGRLATAGAMIAADRMQ